MKKRTYFLNLKEGTYVYDKGSWYVVGDGWRPVSDIKALQLHAFLIRAMRGER